MFIYPIERIAKVDIVIEILWKLLFDVMHTAGKPLHKDVFVKELTRKVLLCLIVQIFWTL